MRPAARRFHVPADRRPAPGQVSGARLVDEKGRPPGAADGPGLANYILNIFFSRSYSRALISKPASISR